MNSKETIGSTGTDGLCGQKQPSTEVLDTAVQAAQNLCLASEHFTQRLSEIEDQIDEACNIDAVRVMRFRLTEYLQQLRDQTLRPRERMAEALAELREQLEIVQGVKSSQKTSAAAAPDTLTGLQARGCAERALATALDAGLPAYAALFVVDRLHVINARYGYSTGDQILRVVCDHLASGVSPGDRLFRWTGPAFVALMERVESLAEIEQEINRIGSAPLKVTVQIGNGSVSLPIPTLSLLVPLSEVKTFPDLTRRMDAFIGEQARH
jgi:GGDEF domain-containing protein